MNRRPDWAAGRARIPAGAAQAGGGVGIRKFGIGLLEEGNHAW
jgi:hypothetical protein